MWSSAGRWGNGTACFSSHTLCVTTCYTVTHLRNFSWPRTGAIDLTKGKGKGKGPNDAGSERESRLSAHSKGKGRAKEVVQAKAAARLGLAVIPDNAMSVASMDTSEGTALSEGCAGRSGRPGTYRQRVGRTQKGLRAEGSISSRRKPARPCSRKSRTSPC